MKERQLLGVRSQSRAIDLVMFILLLTGLNACSQSADQQSKIVGTWEAGAFGISGQQVYSKDGTFRVILPTGGSASGTWAIQGDRLTIKLREGAETETAIAKIITLNDSVLIYELTDKAGKTQASTWKRLR